MTARGTFTMPPNLKRQLRRLADETGISESEHVRNALQLYFDRLGTLLRYPVDQ